MPRRLPCLESLLAAVKAAGFDGINVTFPCKQTVIPLLDEMLSEAQLSVIMIVAALVLPPINVGATDASARGPSRGSMTCGARPMPAI